MGLTWTKIKSEIRISFSSFTSSCEKKKNVQLQFFFLGQA